MNVQSSVGSIFRAARNRKEPPTSLSHEIFRDIRKDIVMCRLAPGEKLRIHVLAERFQTSLSAVREALSRLSAEGLVMAEPQRGFWVAPIAVDDLKDITQARIEIESICIRSSVENGDAAWESELTDAYGKVKLTELLASGTMPVSDEWEEYHNKFHEALVSRCANNTLKSVRQQLFERAERYRRLAGKVSQRERDVDQEHALIFRAALRRDGVLAAALLASHIRETAASLLSVYPRTKPQGRKARSSVL